MAIKHASRMFNAPVPGQGMATHKLGGTPWQQPPKYTNPDDACMYIFGQMTQPNKLPRLLAMFKAGVPLEAVARIVIFSGFSQGLWTPDVGMLISKPVMYMLAAISQRAGLNPKLTHADRSGLKDLVHFKRIFMTNNPASLQQQPKQVMQQPKQEEKPRGLLSPPVGFMGSE